MEEKGKTIKLQDANIIKSLQYIISSNWNDAYKLSNNIFLEPKEVIDESGVIGMLELVCSRIYTEDEVYKLLEKMALRPARCTLTSKQVKGIDLKKPSSVVDKKAVVIHDQDALFCFARDEDALDEMLFEMGYCETETIEIKKKELDLQALGLDQVRFDSHLHKVSFDKASNKWEFTWRGRKRKKASAMIEYYKNTYCKKVLIAFKSSSRGEDDWTNLAIEHMFENKGQLKKGYFWSFNRIWNDKDQKEIRFCALEHSNNQIWLYSPENMDCIRALKTEVENSITRHQVSKVIMDDPQMKQVLDKQKHKWTKHASDSKSVTIVCTSDINLDITIVISKLTDNQSQNQPSNDDKDAVPSSGIPLSPRSKCSTFYLNKLMTLFYSILSNKVLTKILK